MPQLRSRTTYSEDSVAKLKGSTKVLRTVSKETTRIKRQLSAVEHRHLLGVKIKARPRIVKPVPVSTIMTKNADGTYSLIEDEKAWGYLIMNHMTIVTMDRQLDSRLDSESAGYTVGKDPSSNVRISHESAEKRHAFIYCQSRNEKGAYKTVVYLHDQSSKGTWVNGKRISNQIVELKTNDRIYFLNPTKYKDKKENPCYTFVKAHRTTTSVNSFQQLYNTIRTVGQGAFGKVMLAQCKTTGKYVAAKVIPREIFRNHNKEKVSLLREISVCMSFPVHPCIIQIDKVFEIDDYMYIIMEYGVDGDLFDSVTSHEYSLKEDEVKIIFDQIAHAIAFLHDRGIVHRDIKLENVIMCDRKKLTVKLCDFGLSTFIRSGWPLESSCGTTMYAAPELLQSRRCYGLEIDIWSLGVLLFTALATTTPFSQVEDEAKEEEKEELKAQIRRGEFDYSNPVWDTISDEAKDLIEHMLTVDRSERYTIREVLAHPWLQDIENISIANNRLQRNPELAQYLLQNRTRSSISL